MEDFGGFSDDLYPTTNELFNTTGSFNVGGFSNPHGRQGHFGLRQLPQHQRGEE